MQDNYETGRCPYCGSEDVHELDKGDSYCNECGSKF